MIRSIINSTTGKRVRVIALTPGNILLSLAIFASSLSLAVAFTVYIFSKAYKDELTLNKQLATVVSDEMTAKSEVETKSLNRKVKFLVDEFARVRSYERTLKSKVSALGTLLTNILELDHTLLEHNSTPSVSSENKKKGPESLANQTEEGILEEGVGGGTWEKGSIKPTDSIIQKSNVLEPSDTLSALEHSIELLNTIPIGAPVDARYTSGFGKRRSPFSRRRRRRWQFHRGLDMAVARRTPVVATADGTVVSAVYRRGYGRTIKIDHGNGIQTVFAHLQKMNVKKGQKICRGQQIGQVGSSGRSTGPHLHYEVKVNGVYKNPKRFIQLAEFLRLAKI